MTATSPATRLTGYAHGGGCACKIPPGELEDVVRGLMPSPSTTREGELLVGLEDGDDAAAVRIRDGLALIATTDFFTPVVDDPYDWGRIAAANALSDVYAMGGRPVIALNLLCWPREVLPYDLAAEVLRGGLAVADLAGCHVAGGHSVDDPEPKYGMAVTGIADPEALIRNDAARPGTPLTLTKPLGLGVLNNRHKATGEVVRGGRRGDDHAQRRGLARRRRRRASGRAPTSPASACSATLHKLARASGVTAVIDSSAVPFLDGAREAARDGYVPGGSRRNLDWVRPHARLDVDETMALLLADAQTSGGLLLAGEIPGHPVIGEIVAAEEGMTLRVT